MDSTERHETNKISTRFNGELGIRWKVSGYFELKKTTRPYSGAC